VKWYNPSQKAAAFDGFIGNGLSCVKLSIIRVEILVLEIEIGWHKDRALFDTLPPAL